MTEPRIFAVMPAAGSGQRMAAREGAPPKQYLQLNGKTIIEHSIGALLAVVDAENIVVCLAQNDAHWISIASDAGLQVRTTLGGSTRAQSVYNGLQAIQNDAQDQDWVLVHDAARPCLSLAMLSNLLETIGDDPVGGILAIPAKDTLKQAGNNKEILSTLDRSHIWQAQTPQMFRYGVLKSSLGNAIENNIAITDEASALEVAGHTAKLIEGDARNLKVTTSDDLVLAEFILSRV